MNQPRGRRSRRLTAMLAGLAVVLAACTAEGTKAGGGRPPVTLTLAIPDHGPAVPYADVVQLLADRAAEHSGGRIDVAVQSTEIGTTVAELRAAELVASGAADLALLPTRVFEGLRISRMDALQTPFLIDSAEVAVVVAADPVTTEMLASVGQGRVGLGVFFESLRRPVGYPDPLVAVADFASARVRVPNAEASRRLFRALGSEPVVVNRYVTDEAGGLLNGAESAFEWAGVLPNRAVATANVVLFPKFNTLVASQETWDRLDEPDREAILAAVADAVEYAHRKASFTAAADGWCRSRRTLAFASPDDLAALRALAQPVVDQLSADPQTAADIARIREIAADVGVGSSVLPPSCAPATGDSAPWPGER